MTVAELIEQLREMPQDVEVCLYSEEADEIDGSTREAALRFWRVEEWDAVWEDDFDHGARYVRGGECRVVVLS